MVVVEDESKDSTLKVIPNETNQVCRCDNEKIEHIETCIEKILQGDALQFIPFASAIFEFLTDDIPQNSDKIKVAHHIGSKAAVIMNIACQKSNQQDLEESERKAEASSISALDIGSFVVCGVVLQSYENWMKICAYAYLLCRFSKTREFCEHRLFTDKNNLLLGIFCAYVNTDDMNFQWRRIWMIFSYALLWIVTWKISCKIS